MTNQEKSMAHWIPLKLKCHICGANIGYPNTRQKGTYRKKGYCYCTNIACSNVGRSIGMKEERKLHNPMWNEESRKRASESLKRIGHKPPVRGGNGTGMTEPQKKLLGLLGEGWKSELPIGVGAGLREEYRAPNVYKLDLGNKELKLGIECDGNSHGMLARRQQDAKKDAVLGLLGWTVLRFRNERIMNETDLVMGEIMSTVSTLKKTTIS